MAHFVRNYSPNCTFFETAGIQDIINETPLHPFFTCRSTEVLKENFFKWLTIDGTLISKEKNFLLTLKGQISLLQKSTVNSIF
jgi:hypothetical protein